jgi:hypothetical protein
LTGIDRINERGIIMKQTVNRNDFAQAFKDFGREDNFTLAGLNSLFDYLEGIEEDTGSEIELDVIALCCDYSEYDNLAAFRDDYGDEYKTMEDVQDATTVIMVDDERFIVQAF